MYVELDLAIQRIADVARARGGTEEDLGRERERNAHLQRVVEERNAALRKTIAETEKMTEEVRLALLACYAYHL